MALEPQCFQRSENVRLFAAGQKHAEAATGRAGFVHGEGARKELQAQATVRDLMRQAGGTACVEESCSP